MEESRRYWKCEHIRERILIMSNWIADNFTEAERHKIVELHQREFQNMTPDEVQLYARWQSLKAVSDAAIQAQLTAIENESQARIASTNQIKQAAFANLEAQRDAAIAWYESLIGGDD